MSRGRIGLRERPEFVVLVGLAIDTILIVLAYQFGKYIANESVGAFAAVMKYVGIAVAAGLGIAGTVTDTKERTDSGYTVRPVGWIVVTAILLTSVIGALGQYYDDEAKVQAEEAGIQRLERLATLQVRTSQRFSGHLMVIIECEVPANQPFLRAAMDTYKQYAGTSDADGSNPLNQHGDPTAALKWALLPITYSVRLYPLSHEWGADDRDQLLDARVQARSIDQISVWPDRDLLHVTLEVPVTDVENQRLFTIADFGERNLSVGYGRAYVWLPGRGWTRTDEQTVVRVLSVQLLDDELHTTLTNVVDVEPYYDYGYSVGRTRTMASAVSTF